MRFSLDKVTNASVIVAAVAVTAVATLQLTREFRPHNAARTGVARTAGLIGKKVQLPGVNLSDATATVVLALSTSCHYCTNSLPFYRELVRFQEASAKRGKTIRVVVAMPQPETEVSRYLSDNNLGVSEGVSVNLSVLGISATPSLLIVNSQGTIEAAWVGMLTAERQNEVVDALQARCGHCF